MTQKRTWSMLMLFTIFAMVLAACGGGATAPAAPAAPAAEQPAASNPSSEAPAAEAPAAEAPAASKGETLNGIELPADAAPADQQYLVFHYDSTSDFTTIDFYESVYKRGGSVADILSDPLVRLNKEFELEPAGATEWSVDDSGLVWTFKLAQDRIWTDDTPVTAHDYVATFRYAADPEHAWDFTWFFSGIIKNWDEVVAGELPLEELGVVAVDDYTVQFTTVDKAPYLPAMLIYSNTLQKKALETHGGLYNSNVETTVSSGPYVLVEWTKGNRLVYEANPKYKGNIKPYIQKIYVIGSPPAADFAAYQAGELDMVGGANLSPADNEIVQNDPELLANYHPHYGDFRTDYLFFNTTKAPFDDIRVRQAISHIVDRDSLIQSIIKPSQGMPAYSFLMPGFPASNSAELSSIQNYDVEKAKALLAEAGYPDGAGFPKLTLWLRNEAPVRVALAQAIAASMKQNLGIEVEVSNKEYKTFTDAMNAQEIDFGMVSYGFDFLDPYNMLSVWLSGGRHDWVNPEFDRLVREAAAFTGDTNERIKMFQQAERILVEDVPGVFVYHRTVGDLYRPYLVGSELEPDSNGIAAIHWPGFASMGTVIGSAYIHENVANFTRVKP
jgi:ABC-type oligopeptide transport system substrate-binding subunit